MTTANNTANIGIIILAAGRSSRLGKPKQLLPYKGKSLLQHTINIALNSDGNDVFVVLGADAESLRKEINEETARVIINDQWEEGMASSIRKGITALTENSPDATAVILMVCDQPFVTVSVLNSLISAHIRSGQAVVACSYDNTFGPPVLFHRSLFNELLELKGDTGARTIVKTHAENVELVPFPYGTFDIDTELDYERLKSASTND